MERLFSATDMANKEDDEAHLEDVLLQLAASHFFPDFEAQPRLLATGCNAIPAFFEVADDLAFIKEIRLDKSLFNDLLARVQPIYEGVGLRPTTGTTQKKSRCERRSLSCAEALLITLRMLAGGAPYTEACNWSGKSFSTIVRMFGTMLRTLVAVLRHWNLSQIRMPDNREAELLTDRISARLAHLHSFIGFMDGIVVVFKKKITQFR